MTAFVIATSKIKDPSKFAEYGKAAAATLGAHGGSLVKRGQYQAALAGNAEHNASAVLAFPDLDALNAWFNSAEYQSIVPLRNEACEMTITSYVEPNA